MNTEPDAATPREETSRRTFLAATSASQSLTGSNDVRITARTNVTLVVWAVGKVEGDGQLGHSRPEIVRVPKQKIGNQPQGGMAAVGVVRASHHVKLHDTLVKAAHL